MAALESQEMVTITVNDVDLQVPKGELIVESVKRLGLEIPIFCYHPRMKPVGMCRMCLVEVGFKQQDGTVRKMPKPQAGCTLPADNNMVIYTDSEMVHRDRKGVLEFLLINHPLDCPICDRGGECPLQNNTLFYGPSTSRFTEVKRHALKAFPLSKYVTLDLERCIQCGRCVRFTEEISGDSQLAFRFRGASMQPSTFQMHEFESKFSGNVIEICPVGALTSSRYRFRARPWDLATRPAICTNCSNGCNIWFDYRAGKMVRINGRTNEAVNEEWTCDRGKFGHDWYNSERRLKQPMLRKGDKMVPVSWAEAYEAILQACPPSAGKMGGLVAGTVSNEGLYLFQKMLREVFGSNHVDYRWTRNRLSSSHPLSVGANPSNKLTPIAAYELFDSALIFATALADEQPMIYLRLRKGWSSKGTKVVVFADRPVEEKGFAALTVHYRPGSEDHVAEGLLKAGLAAGKVMVPGEVREKIEALSFDRIASFCDVTEGQFRQAVDLLSGTGVVVSSQSLLDLPEGVKTLEILADFSNGLGFDFNCYALGANDEGAARLGVLPDRLPNGRPLAEPGLDTAGILDAAARARISALWVVEGDPISRYHEKGDVVLALENVDFLIYQGTLANETANYASVILPMEAPAEQEGTYTNVEGRVQRMIQVVQEPGDAKQAWRIFGEILLRSGHSKPYFSASEVMEEIAQVVPSFGEVTYDRLEGEGLHLPLATSTDVLSEVN
ncbi:MAG: NADH-quinone oxidoreductase subunit NuoG [Armatimonadetes bacterium]|nr:NADH-quinone oxidoreductase subunit NuoG [Armatimonadota bacterium]